MRRQSRVSRAERKLEEESGRMLGTFQLNKGRGKGSAYCNIQRREKAAIDLETEMEERARGQRTGPKTRLRAAVRRYHQTRRFQRVGPRNGKEEGVEPLITPV